DFHVTGVQTCALPILRGRQPQEGNLRPILGETPCRDDVGVGESIAGVDRADHTSARIGRVIQDAVGAQTGDLGPVRGETSLRDDVGVGESIVGTDGADDASTGVGGVVEDAVAAERGDLRPILGETPLGYDVGVGESITGIDGADDAAAGIGRVVEDAVGHRLASRVWVRDGGGRAAPASMNVCLTGDLLIGGGDAFSVAAAGSEHTSSPLPDLPRDLGSSVRAGRVGGRIETTFRELALSRARSRRLDADMDVDQADFVETRGRAVAIEAFRLAADHVVALTAAVPADRWDAPALGSWTVRSLVGHTGRALSTVVEYLARPAVEHTVLSTADYYTRAAERVDA